MTSDPTMGDAAEPGVAGDPGPTDAAPDVDVTETEQYRAERATIRRQRDEGDLRPLEAEHPFPPTRYDEQQPETD